MLAEQGETGTQDISSDFDSYETYIYKYVDRRVGMIHDDMLKKDKIWKTLLVHDVSMPFGHLCQVNTEYKTENFYKNPVILRRKCLNFS